MEEGMSESFTHTTVRIRWNASGEKLSKQDYYIEEVTFI